VGKVRAMENTTKQVGLELADLTRFAEHRGFKCEDLVSVDRILIPKARHARLVAHHRITQPPLPFEPTCSWVIDPLRGV
jgi:hypothetical protein